MSAEDRLVGRKAGEGRSEGGRESEMGGAWPLTEFPLSGFQVSLEHQAFTLYAYFFADPATLAIRGLD